MCLQDIPDKLKAEPDTGGAATHMHRKELRLPKHGLNPLGYYFQEEAHLGGLTGGAGDAGAGTAPADKPLKYYFTKDIPDDAKRQLAFKAMMKAQMDGVHDPSHLSPANPAADNVARHRR